MNASMHNGFALAAALSCAAASALARPWEYAVIDIGDLGYGASARAINELGEITGTADDGDITSFFWSEPGPMLGLEGLPGADGWARGWAINRSGWIAGEAWDASHVIQPVIWKAEAEPSEVLDDSWLGGQCEDVNDAGVVVGSAQWDLGEGQYVWNGFVWSEGQLARLRGLLGYGSSAGTKAINSRGHIAGSSDDIDSLAIAVLWRGSEVIRLGDLGRPFSAASDLNDFDQVVGWSYDEESPVHTHAFLWNDGTMVDLHGLGRDSYAEGINNFGEVVGWSTFSDTPYDWTGFRWRAGEGMIDLNRRTPPNCPYAMIVAEDINDAGQIVGSATYNGSTWADWAILLTPVHPSMTLTPTGGALVAGRMNELVIRGATPGKRVYFAYSEQGGGSYIPGCTLQENALQLQDPKTLGSAVADADGVARLQRYIPRPALGRTLLLQAVVPGECAVSELVMFTIE